MARIRSSRVGEATKVIVSGRLRAADMRRLEHACREALTRHPLKLHLDLTRVSDTDDTARAVVSRLQHRGAQVLQLQEDVHPISIGALAPRSVH